MRLERSIRCKGIWGKPCHVEGTEMQGSEIQACVKYAGTRKARCLECGDREEGWVMRSERQPRPDAGGS